MGKEKLCGQIKLDYIDPTAMDRDILMEEFAIIRSEILRALARGRVVFERILKEKYDLDLIENTDEETEHKRKLNNEELEGAKEAIVSLKNRLEALKLVFELVGAVKNGSLLPELLSIEE